MNEEIDFDDIEFGEPIEEREPNYRDGYIQGIYRARNIIDSKQKEIERLNNIINELEKLLEKEQDRLARETSNIYEDSLGKIRLVNENIYEEVQKIKDKLQELKGSNKQ